MAFLVIGVAVGPGLFSRSKRAGAHVAAGLAGALIPLALFGGAYWASWGTTTSDYLALSSRIGFEPGLLPLRCVSLVINPRPLFSEGRGLAETFF